jgi:hypothetical protein
LNALPSGRTHTFIVRVWMEVRENGAATPEDGAEWRGEIKHVPSGEVVYFRRLQALPEALERIIQRSTQA